MLNQQNIKHDGFDLLKFICSILIIPLHINPFAQGTLTRFITKGIGNVGVPVFFILSGYFLFKKIIASNAETHITILKSYLKRLLILLLFWTIPYFLVYDISWIKSGNILFNIFEYFKHVLFGGPGYFLWYIVSLFFAAIYCYALRNACFYISLPIVALLFLVGIIGTSYNFLIKDTFLEEILGVYFEYFYTLRNGLFFGLPCVFIGMVFAKHSEKLKNKSLAIALLSISLLMIFTEFYILYYYKVQVGIMQLSVILLSCALIVALYSYKISLGAISIILRKLSFLVYVIHPLYIVIIPYVLSKSGGLNLDYYWYSWYWLQIPIILITSVITGLIIIWISRKYTFLKKAM